MLKEIEDYFEYINNYGYKPPTIRQKTRAVKRLSEFMEKENIASFETLNISAFIDFIKSIKYSESTTTSIYEDTRCFYSYLFKKGLIKDNPFFQLAEPMKKEIEEYINCITDQEYSSKTIKIKTRALKKLNEFMREEKINAFNNFDLAQADLLREYLVKTKLAKVTRKGYLKNIKRFFNYLVLQNIIKNNPFLNLKKEPLYPQDLKKHFNLYLKIKESEFTPYSTLVSIKSSIKALYLYLTDIGITQIREITKAEIKSFIAYLIDKKDKRGNKYYKNVSINRMLNHIRNYFLFLKNNNACNDVLSVLVNLRHTEKVSRNILTRKELTNLFNVEAEDLYQFMMKTIFVCLYSTGLRINELLSVKLDDIDYENKTLLVYEEKTKKERYVHIGEVGINYLKIFITHARDKIGYASYKSNLVFVSSVENSRVDRWTVNKHLKIFCKKAGITKIVTTHCFRHSYGSHLLENGAGIKIISELLGHAQISSTERYTKLGSESLREIVNTFHPREREAEKWD